MDKFLQMLGLAKKAGAVAAGGTACEEVLAKGTAKLCIMAADAAANTKKRFEEKCAARNVKVVLHSDKTEMGHILGRDETSVVCIKNERFARQLLILSEKEIRI